MVNGGVELMVELNDTGGVFHYHNDSMTFCVLWDCLGDLVFGENPLFPPAATVPKRNGAYT